MEKQFTIKTDDANLQIESALNLYSNSSYQGSFKGFDIRLSSVQGLAPKSYWYAVKDNVAYTDRGLTGLLIYIEKDFDKSKTST